MQELREEGIVGAICLGVNEWQVCSRAMASAFALPHSSTRSYTRR